MRQHLLLLAALLCALGLAVPSAKALDRPVSKIERAWLKACPHLRKSTAKRWSPILKKEAKKRGFCPYTVVSMVKHETGSTCNERVTKEIGSAVYVGLGQINAMFSKPCGVKGRGSPECAGYIAKLQDGGYNLRRIAIEISSHRKYCRRKTGQSALFARWLTSYQGFNNHARSGRTGVWCNMRRDKRGNWRDVKTPKFTRRVMKYRRLLVRTLG